MANIKQQKKRIKQDAKHHDRNQHVRSRMKTLMKKAQASLAEGNADAAKPAVTEAISAIDRAASKGVIHPNSAARKKSSLMHRASAAQ
jgi:small subunit ribosomal protein S20